MVGERGERLAGFGVSVFDALTGGRFVTLPRSELSRLILERRRRRRPSVRGRGRRPAQDAGGVDVTFASGAAGRYDLVVGAGGLHSGVRRLVFGPDESSRSRSATPSPLSKPTATTRAIPTST